MPRRLLGPDNPCGNCQKFRIGPHGLLLCGSTLSSSSGYGPTWCGHAQPGTPGQARSEAPEWAILDPDTLIDDGKSELPQSAENSKPCDPVEPIVSSRRAWSQMSRLRLRQREVPAGRYAIRMKRAVHTSGLS